MKHKDHIRSFLDGETHCIQCGVPLPAHDTWPGKRTHTCQGLACVSDLDVLSSRLKSLVPGSLLVRPETEVCHGPKCGRFVPAGIYGSRSKNRCCTAECWYRKDMNPTAMYVCVCGCGKTFGGNRSMSRRKGIAFFNLDHRAKFLLEANISECGDLGNVAREFLDTFVRSHYRNAKNSETAPYFLSLSGVRRKALSKSQK